MSFEGTLTTLGLLRIYYRNLKLFTGGWRHETATAEEGRRSSTCSSCTSQMTTLFTACYIYYTVLLNGHISHWSSSQSSSGGRVKACSDIEHILRHICNLLYSTKITALLWAAAAAILSCPVLYCSTTSDLINYIPSHVCGGWHRTRTEPEIVLRPHLWTNKFMRAQHASCPEHMTIASLVTLTGQLPAADDNKQLHQRTNYNYEKNPIGLSAGNY